MYTVILPVGLTVKLVPTWLPGFNVYVAALLGFTLGVITIEEPLQITLLLPKGLIVIVGVGFTVKVSVKAGLGAQPLATPFTV